MAAASKRLAWKGRRGVAGVHMGGVAEGIFPASLVDGEVRVAKVKWGRFTRSRRAPPWGSAVTCVVAAGLLAGCQSGGLVGNGLDASVGSLSDRRAANRSISIVSTPPAGSRYIETLTAQRCHRYLGVEEPSDAVVTADLRAQAYAEGADFMTTPVLTKANGLMSDCWYELQGQTRIYAR